MSNWRGENNDAGRAPRRRTRRGRGPLERGTGHPTPKLTPPCSTCKYPLRNDDRECPRCRHEGRL